MTNSAARKLVLTLPIFHFSAVAIAAGLLVLLMAGSSVALADTTSKTQPCFEIDRRTAGFNADDATDRRAFRDYQEATSLLFEEERFKELDCLADSLRVSKAKFAGGMWKIHAFYSGLREPRLHPTQEDWNNHLDRLKRWVKINPSSITARVALAQSYVTFAQDARGSGFADTVSESGWRLFHERVQEARRILEEAEGLPAKCPEWFLGMQQVSEAEGWDLADEVALLNKATEFEPGYQYFARLHANYLLPKWYGEEGDTEKYVTETADKIGGEEGDVFYFQVSSFVLCGCSQEVQFKKMSWPRIQRGFAILDKRSGPSLELLNLMAYMAGKAADPVIADKAFARIGDNWNEDRWKTRAYFDSSKEWAARGAATASWRLEKEEAAAQNAKTEEGSRYQALFSSKFAEIVGDCARSAQSREKIVMLMRMSQEGFVLHWVPISSGEATNCAIRKVTSLQQNFVTNVLPGAPQINYWVKAEVDPASAVPVASK